MALHILYFGGKIYSYLSLSCPFAFSSLPIKSLFWLCLSIQNSLYLVLYCYSKRANWICTSNTLIFRFDNSIVNFTNVIRAHSSSILSPTEFDIFKSSWLYRLILFVYYGYLYISLYYCALSWLSKKYLIWLYHFSAIYST